MFSLSFERMHRVLRVKFRGVYEPEDLDRLDPAMIDFLRSLGSRHEDVRVLYDMSDVVSLAVPESKCAERARKPPIAGLDRIVVAPLGADDNFGRSYLAEQGLSLVRPSYIVRNIVEAYDLLGLVDPHFEGV